MKNIYKILICSIFTLCCSGLFAQVSFTDMGGILGATNGNSYEDCAVDMNGDFLDDVVRVTNDRIYIDYQQANGTFTQNEFPMTFQNYPSWSICAGDIDNNGFNDLLFGGGSRVSFIYANADGTAYTEDFHDEYIFSQRTTFADIDNDGNLDAFVCHDVDQSHPFRNDGSGVLTEDQNLIQTLNLAGNYAALWVDYDNDWDTDLYITKCRQGSTPGDIERTNAMYRNNGDGTYTEVGAAIGMADNAQSWATVFEDFDNDGDFDAFIVNHDEQNRFMINDGNGNYTESIATTGIPAGDLGAWENASGDFNNDGYIDIFSELSKELYLNNGDMTFTGYDLPFDDGGIGDFNNDGFLDVIRGNSLWINDTNNNNWVKINTQGIVSNKNGIGARVEIHGPWGVQIREVRAGQSFSPMSSMVIHFGLGTYSTIDSIVIKWPSGIETILNNPAINTTHDIPEASCLLASSIIQTSGSTEFCAGGSVVLTAPAGFANYTWSNGATTPSITVTQPGSYSVVSEDSGDCISLSNNVITSIVEDEIPTISLTGDNRFCAGQTAMISASNNSNPVWSNGMTGQNITVTESGSYFVQTDGVCSGTPLTSSSIDIEVISNDTPTTEDVVISTPGPATLTASGGNDLVWYDSQVGGNEIGTGNTYNVAFTDVDLTVYVESQVTEGGALQDGGKIDNAGGGGLPSTGAYNYFNVFEPFTLLKVTVYVPVGAPVGNRDIQLVDENDVVLADMVVNLGEGQHELDLNFDVPVGTGFSLRCLQNDLFRNNSGVSYPYAIGDVGEITTSFYGTSYYYYFYNWKIEKEKLECISDRVEANVFIYDAVSNNEIEGALTGLSIYPNPAQDEVNISFEALEQMDLTVQLFDMTGREVKSIKEFPVGPGEQVTNFKLGKLPSGIYYVQLSTNGRSIQQKIVVQ